MQNLKFFAIIIMQIQSGHSSVVERYLAKVHVARSTRVTRFLFIFLGRKGGRVVECIGFENRRSRKTTEGSNPSLSE